MAFAAMRDGAGDDSRWPMPPFAGSESDWLVGINGTRAMTAFNSKGGGFQLTPVGRVQTPTLAILAERETKIREFKPRTYFEVFGDFGVTAGIVSRPLVRRKIQEGRRGRHPGRAHLGQDAGGSNRSQSARARPARSRKRRSPPARLPRCFTISPPCSARPTPVSRSAPSAPCKSHRLSTRSTRC